MNKKAFMVMPFSDNVVKNAYDHVVKPVFDRFDIHIRKADEIWSVAPVYDDIVSEIHKASLVVVDISGNNPNVFYELGIAHTLKSDRTIILTHDDFSTTPFDVAHFRIIQYFDSIESSKKLEQSLTNTIKIILSDKIEDYRQEFEVVYNITISEGLSFFRFEDIIALDINNGSIPRGYGFIFSRFNQKEIAPNGLLSKLSDNYRRYESIGYVESDNKAFYITDKGKLFVKYLLEIKKFPKFEIELFKDK